MTVPFRIGGAMKPAASLPAAIQNQRQEEPVEVEDQRQGGTVEVWRHHDQQQPAWPQHEENGGYVHKQLGECPARCTVSDLLQWSIPTEDSHRDQGPKAQVQGSRSRSSSGGACPNHPRATTVNQSRKERDIKIPRLCAEHSFRNICPDVYLDMGVGGHH